MDRDRIELKPVGVVVSDIDRPSDMPLTGQAGMIQVFPDYAPALYRIEENSHLWVLSWYHEADRSLRRVAPMKLNPALGERGVFALRCHSRPNPIALSLVRLIKVDGNLLHVADLDSVAGTPVLDIKPYFGQDIIASPRTPYLRPASPEVKTGLFMKEAMNHHQENCPLLRVGVAMALVAEARFESLQAPDLKVKVTGEPCLADVIQGLTRARLANPPRFEYRADPSQAETLWNRGADLLKLRLRKMPKPGEKLDNDQLFDVEETGFDSKTA